jgi:CPA2 family monovalent cation:H+ antiporter-2
VAAQVANDGAAFIAVDLNPHRVSEARRLGLPVYYGDATRPEILEAVHVERARAFVIAIDQPETALRLVSLVRYIFPDLKVYARARDSAHAEELSQAGAHTVVPELVATGVKLAGSIAAAALAPTDGPEPPDEPPPPE